MNLTIHEQKRFWDKVQKTNFCWEWLAVKCDGYGQICLQSMGGIRYAHRVSYELLVGPIPKGLQLDHLCRNRACVNPAHLEPVTVKENVLRGDGLCAKNSQKTHCHKGHPLSGDNLSVKQTKVGPERRCKICHNEECRKRRRKP